MNIFLSSKKDGSNFLRIKQGWDEYKKFGPIFPMTDEFPEPLEWRDGFTYYFPNAFYHAQKVSLEGGLGYGTDERAWRRQFKGWRKDPEWFDRIGGVNGSWISCRTNWKKYRLEVMRTIINHRFQPGSPECEKLVNTERDLILWLPVIDFSFWGRSLYTMKGKDYYGQMLRSKQRQCREGLGESRRKIKEILDGNY